MPLSHVTVRWKFEPVAGPLALPAGTLVSCVPTKVKSLSANQPTAAAVPEVATVFMWQPTVDPLGTLAIDTMAAVIGLSSRKFTCGGGGGGGGGGTYAGTYSLVAGGSYAGSAGGAAGAGGGGGGGSGAHGSSVRRMYPIDHVARGVAASIFAGSRSLGPSTAMLTPAAIAALATKTPGHRYHDDVVFASICPSFDRSRLDT